MIFCRKWNEHSFKFFYKTFFFISAYGFNGAGSEIEIITLRQMRV